LPLTWGKKGEEGKDLLEVSGLTVFYGGIHALQEVSLSVPEGKVVTLIGANGAGKSTALRAISGLVESRRGKIFFREREIQNWPAHRIARLGIVMVPEGRRIFTNLTVKENLLLGAFSQKSEKDIREDLEGVFQLFPRLRERGRQKGGTLSGGEQQMLALGRGLMSRPDLLMLDEPSLGLAPKLVHEVFGIIRGIHEKGMTILLIEQNAMAALTAADYGYVLQSGRLRQQGRGGDLLRDPSVKEAYLGEATGQGKEGGG
jgi:branched-chain amino acid transport system ATP-binding protein